MEENSVQKTIEKLKVNKFRYASAGDVKRLVDEIERLTKENQDMKFYVEPQFGR